MLSISIPDCHFFKGGSRAAPTEILPVQAPSPDTQTQQQQNERSEAREGADVVPERPFRDIGDHRLGVFGPGRVQGRDFAVQGHVEDAGDAEGAQEVDEGGGQRQPACGGVAAQERMKRGGDAKDQCAEKAEREDGVSHGQVDSLHGGQGGERLHGPEAGHDHERESEEEPGHHPNPDGAGQAHPKAKGHRHYKPLSWRLWPATVHQPPRPYISFSPIG